MSAESIRRRWTRAPWPFLVCASGLGLLFPAAAEDEQPAICREAIARHGGEPLAALAAEEQDRWREARKAQRKARGLLRDNVGLGPHMRAVEQTAEVAALERYYVESLRVARTICGCRERRGDPHRQDCERQYAKFLAPSRR